MKESTLPLDLLHRGKVRDVYQGDAETLLMTWGGDRIRDLPEVLARYGVQIHGRRAGLWQPGFASLAL